MITISEITKAFTQAATDIITMLGGPALIEGESYQHRHTQIENSVAIYIGLVGQIQGYLLIRVSEEIAKRIASLLMGGMPVEQLDDMTISALSELGNMIAGSSATNLSVMGIEVDITTPTMLQGTVQISHADIMPVSVPLTGGDLRIVLDLGLKVIS